MLPVGSNFSQDECRAGMVLSVEGGQQLLGKFIKLIE